MNGRDADVDGVAALATLNYGHFTSMQMRDGGVRGLQLHLHRLDRASHELFGVGLDPQRVRSDLRVALAGLDAASVRVSVFPLAGLGPDDQPADLNVLITVDPPREDKGGPLRLQIVEHERYLPHLKHVATLPLIHLGRQARRAGFDDALFVDRRGFVSEGTIWNLGLFDGESVVWPEASGLAGITMELVARGLKELGIPQRRQPIHQDELRGYRGGFITYSIAAGRLIGSVGGCSFDPNPDLAALVLKAYERQPIEAP